MNRERMAILITAFAFTGGLLLGASGDWYDVPSSLAGFCTVAAIDFYFAKEQR